MGRLTLAQRFMVGSLVILLLGMAGIGAWIARQIEAGVVHRTAATTALYVDSLIAPSLQGLADGGSLPAADAARLDWLLKDTPLGREVDRLPRLGSRGPRRLQHRPHPARPAVPGRRGPRPGAGGPGHGRYRRAGRRARSIGVHTDRQPVGDLQPGAQPRQRRGDRGRRVLLRRRRSPERHRRRPAAKLARRRRRHGRHLPPARRLRPARQRYHRAASSERWAIRSSRLTELLQQNEELHERVRGRRVADRRPSTSVSCAVSAPSCTTARPRRSAWRCCGSTTSPPAAPPTGDATARGGDGAGLDLIQAQSAPRPAGGAGHVERVAPARARQADAGRDGRPRHPRSPPADRGAGGGRAARPCRSRRRWRPRSPSTGSSRRR